MRVLAPRAQNVEQPKDVGLIVDYKHRFRRFFCFFFW